MLDKIDIDNQTAKFDNFHFQISQYL